LFDIVYIHVQEKLEETTGVIRISKPKKDR